MYHFGGKSGLYSIVTHAKPTGRKLLAETDIKLESVCFYNEGKYKTPSNTNNDTGIDSKGKQLKTVFMDNGYNYYNYPGNYFGNIETVQLRSYVDTCINRIGNNSRECTQSDSYVQAVYVRHWHACKHMT